MNWPSDADGDVLRMLRKKRFDFSKQTDIDFNIDFKNGPPSERTLENMATAFPTAQISVEAEDDVLVTIRSLLTYDFVVSTQARLTEIASADGGVCEAWGVFS